MYLFRLHERLLLLTLILLPLAIAKYSEWEGIVPYCEVAPVRCSSERNDEAFMPYNGSRCYCDYFCFRSEQDHDCCPDFEYVCQPRGPVAPPIGETRYCEWDGKQYSEGGSTCNDCNTCICTVGAGSIGLQWVCDSDMCGNDMELIEGINRAGIWTASSYPRWSSQKYKTIKQYTLGTILDEREKQRMNGYNYRDPDASIYGFTPPAEWNAEDAGWAIAPVRDQGKCGSSWALSAVDAASDRLSAGQTSQQLSVQYVLSCSEREAKDGCRAGRIHYAWGFLKDFGSVQEADYSYDSGRTGLIGYCRHEQAQEHLQRSDRFSPAYRVNSDPFVIKHELYTRGPVQATLLVCPDFYQYWDGVYRKSWTGPSSLCDYHSVRIIGWGTAHSAATGEKEEYWLCINSWGPEWGQKGRFRIKIGDSEINDYVISTWAVQH